METLFDLLTSYASIAPYVMFGLLLLAGLNIPISEDAVLLIGGAVAHTLPWPEVVYLYAWLFAGCYISAWEAFWLGRVLGPKICEHRVLGHWISRHRLDQIGRFYSRHGFLTLFFGRFIPFGVRNALFISAGMSGMRFRHFILRDSVGCITSSALLFFSAYAVGKNLEAIRATLATYHQAVGIGIALLAIVIITWRLVNRPPSTNPATSD